VLVDQSATQVQGVLQKAEITDTPAYRALHGSFKTVAIRMPDNCFEAKLHSAENRADSQLESSCGIPLQVLESTLTQAGYQVLSWTTLMGIEHDQRVPVHIAAQQLGADIIVVVNDAFAGLEKTGGEAESRYRYLLSDPEGNVKGPVELFEADRGWLKQFVRGHVGNDPLAHQDVSLRARLNATVVLAKGNEVAVAAAPPSAAAPPGAVTPPTAPTPAPTPAPATTSFPPGLAARSGEAIWFYNWSLGDVVHTSRPAPRFLFASIPVGECKVAFPSENGACKSDDNDPNRHYWWPVAPPATPNTPPPPDLATSEEGRVTRAEVGGEKAAILAHRIADNFVHRFKEGI